MTRPADPSATVVDFTRAVLAQPPDPDGVARFASRIHADRPGDPLLRLAPMAHRVLPLLGDHPAVPLIAGMYRKAYFRNRLLLSQGLRLIGLLEARGVPSAVLKGIPLALAHYGDLGARPMSDFDLLVPEDVNAQTVADAAAAMGLRPHSRQVHAWTFVDDLGLEFDIHRYLAPSLAYRGSSASLWRSLQPMEVGGAALQTLPPEGHVAHALVHSVAWNTSPPVRWIPDVALIQRNASPDWTVVWALLHEWGWSTGPADEIDVLWRAGLVPEEARSADTTVNTERWIDRAVQSMAVQDPREHPMRHVGNRMVAMPARLYSRTDSPRPNAARWYARYLDDLWEVNEGSLASAAARRIRARLRHGRVLPVYDPWDEARTAHAR